MALEILMQHGISSSEREVSNRGRKTFAGIMAQCCVVCVRTVTQRENSQGLEMQLSGRGPTQNVYDTGLDPTHKTDKQQNTEMSYMVPQL